MSMTVGTRLGPYEIQARLGAGGMGEVWKARDTRLDRAVAIKRLKADFSTRFEREARAIAALNHPHICQIYDIGPDYFVMEYVEGAPVKGPLPPGEVVKLALQITGALEAAHAAGIIHRDLKPDNILVGSAGVKLLDFGLAKQTMAGKDETQTTAGTIAGTASYMSPEQARGDTIDRRSDIFSLGAVLYELLAGRRPFPGSSIAEILSSILRDEPRTLEAPPELGRIVQRCLRKPREERFASMADLRAALERAHLTTEQASIAVLPFANMSRDADDEYFSDGLGEEIINSLVKVPGLKVIARTSSFAFKGQHKDIREIAAVLGVTNVLEGSVRRAGDRIRVTAQLVSATDGSHLWSERYDRQMEDIFTMQDEIAASIASALELRFAPEPAARARRQPNLQAYEAYLRYRHHQWGFTEESLRLSRECLEQAIAIDPGYALPYAGLADHHLASTVADVPAREAMPQARELAERALQADPDLPEGHGMLGIVAGHFDLDWAEAARRFRLAMAGSPVPWHVRQWNAYFHLFTIGRTEEAAEEAERTIEDDPLSQVNYAVLGAINEGLGLEDKARAAYERMLELDPKFWWGWWHLGMHHAVHGRTADARQCAERAIAIHPTARCTIGLLAGTLRMEGDTTGAAARLAQAPEGSDGAPLARTCYHLVCGDIDQAMKWAVTAVDQRNATFAPSVVRAYEKRLAGSSEWPSWLAKMNFGASEI